MKVCGRCKEEKPTTEYYRKGAGLQPNCKKCANEYKREWLHRSRDNVRWNTLWSKYRLRREDWNQMFDCQQGLCAICRQNTATHVDHDHSCCPVSPTCGRCVRQLLCDSCNKILGVLESNLERLEDFQNYIKKHGVLE